jgi:hypothetical protein
MHIGRANWRLGAGLGLVVMVGLGWVAGCKKSAPEGELAKPGESKREAQITAQTNLAARIHWLGKKRLATETNATYFMGIWNLPESVKLEEQTLEKLSTAPWRFWGAKSTPEPAPTNQSPSVTYPLSGAFKQVLEDLLNEECYVEIATQTNQPTEAVVAVRLSPDRSKLWQTNLASVVESLGGSRAVSDKSGTGWQSTIANRPPGLTNAQAFTAEFRRVGDWTLVGLAQQRPSLLGEMASRLQRNSAPFPAQKTNFWAEAELNLAVLAGVFPGLSSPRDLPRVFLTLIGDGERIQARGRLNFPKEVPLQVDPWNIPTNLIREPLISFTAVQGFGRWLGEQKLWKDASLGPAPNQIYFWALDGAPLQGFFAVPHPNASNLVSRLNDYLMHQLNPKLAHYEMGEFVHSKSGIGADWTGNPFIAPFTEYAPLQEGEFMWGGLLRSKSPNRATVPEELSRQVLGHTNLVYYDWEVTEPRLRDWLYNSQFTRFFFGKPQLPPASASLRWLIVVGQKLGNCATVVNRTGPAQLSFVRQSNAGLTAPELQLVADWLESPDFPRGLHSLLATNEADGGVRRMTTNSMPPLSPPPQRP